MTRLKAFLAVSIAVASPLWAESNWIAEDQTATGKFLTATEIRPILGATQGNWIAVREFNGKDLLYFTHLLAWRCGLHEIRFSVNDGDTDVLPMPDCDPNSPNTIPDDATIYLEYPLGSIKTVGIELLYDDLEESAVSFDRKNVMTP